jgi:hypothetical protein
MYINFGQGVLDGARYFSSQYILVFLIALSDMQCDREGFDALFDPCARTTSSEGRRRKTPERNSMYLFYLPERETYPLVFVRL